MASSEEEALVLTTLNAAKGTYYAPWAHRSLCWWCSYDDSRPFYARERDGEGGGGVEVEMQFRKIKIMDCIPT
jgi:hypothetical protein